MRITFVMASADLSGGNRVISIYADRLARRGHTVTLVSRPRRPVTLKDKGLAWLRGHPVPKNQRHWPSHFDALVGPTHRPIKQYRPIVAADLADADVVIATWWETAEWVAALPPGKGRRAYFIQHYEAHGGQPADRVDATWRLPLHKIIIAEWLMKIAANRGDTSASYVPNAVDTDQFHAPPRGKQPTPTVGVMYSTIPFKGCDVSLKAFELARETIPELKLVAFGNRDPDPALPLPPGTDYARQPPQDRIRDVYARCDAWLFGSRSEGFGLPLLEAMACRTPVIATPTGAAPELVAKGGGLLVPPEDPRAMADAIRRVAAMADERWRALSDSAAAAATGYTWDDATTRFEAALGRAV